MAAERVGRSQRQAKLARETRAAICNLETMNRDSRSETKTILLVDDDQSFLEGLVVGLNTHPKRRFLIAHDGRGAIEIIEASAVDLVITDLEMPGVSGFDLLAYLARRTPPIPAIAMSASTSSAVEKDLEALGVRSFIEKSTSLSAFETCIEAVLSGSQPAPHADSPFGPRGDAVLLALREAIRNGISGELVVRSEQKTGRLFITAGEVGWVYANTTQQTLASLIASRVSIPMDELLQVVEESRRTRQSFGRTLMARGLIDEPALRRYLFDHTALGLSHILSWDAPEIVLVPAKNPPRPGIRFALDDLLRDAPPMARSAPSTEPPAASSPEALAPLRGVSVAPPSDEEPMGAHMQAPQIVNVGVQAQKIREALDSLRSVDGFVGAAAFLPSGNMVAEVSNGELDLAEFGVLANDLLLKTQKTTDIMGIGRGNDLHVTTPKAHVIVRCLNENTDPATDEPGRAHVHMVLVLSPEGNVALGKMYLEKVIQQTARLMR